jgi:paired amphipathic helix protein Sin3a
MYPAAEFNAACGPLDAGQDDEWTHEPQRSGRRSTGSTHSNGVLASDLRKKLLKTAQEKSSGKDLTGSSAVHSRASPAPSIKSQNMAIDDGDKVLGKSDDDVWIKESQATATTRYLDGDKTPPFFVNTTFYTLVRLLQVCVY